MLSKLNSPRVSGYWVASVEAMLCIIDSSWPSSVYLNGRWVSTAQRVVRGDQTYPRAIFLQISRFGGSGPLPTEWLPPPFCQSELNIRFRFRDMRLHGSGSHGSSRLVQAKMSHGR